MRLLHTGDWHIGKRLYGVDRLGEIAEVLDEVADIARRSRVDAILVAGDILDRRLVEPIVLSTCLQALERLAAVAPVVAVTGNHDEPLFWAEIAPYLAPRILLAASDAVLPVETASGRLTVGCMPWPEPAEAPVAPGTPRPEARERYSELVRERLTAMGRQVEASQTGRPGPAVLLAHLMMRGGVSGGGERELTLGGTYAIPGADVPACFDYVALGHLHKPQDVRSLPTLGRYCGSPLALDFSGDGASPSVMLVDIEDGVTQLTEVPVTRGRRLVRLRGTMDELPDLAAVHEGAWFHCEVVSDELRLDAVREVRDRIPGALRVEQTTRSGGTPHAIAGEDEADAARSLPEMYAAWLRSVGRPATGEMVTAFDDALHRAAEDDG